MLVLAAISHLCGQVLPPPTHNLGHVEPTEGDLSAEP
jgi:hypothetical protein